MKIPVEPKGQCNTIFCLSEDCPWKKVCTNHITAGDFRSESGTRPLLTLIDGEVHCETFQSPGDGFEYIEQPVNFDKTWVPDKWNMFLWSELIETGA